MRVVQKKVYYCDYCKRHGLARVAMEKHERNCTLNPLRECRWQPADGQDDPVFYLPRLVEEVRARAPLEQDDIEWLRAAVGGCPACMLAALRQGASVPVFTQQGGMLWTYSDEVEAFRKAERAAWQDSPDVW